MQRRSPEGGSGQPLGMQVVALACLIGSTAFAVDVSVPAIPATAEHFRTDPGAVQLTVGLYLLGYALGQIPMGFLADHLGRRKVVVSLMSLFVIAGLLSTMAPTVESLVAVRFIQGFFGASGAVISRAIARDITEGRDTTRLLSLLTSTTGVAMVVAPAIGVLALNAFGWHGPFGVSALLGLLGVALTSAFLPETMPAPRTRSPGQRFLDGFTAFLGNRQSIVGALLVALSFTALISFITKSSEIYMLQFGVGGFAFAATFATVSVAHICGGLINRRLAARHGNSELSRIAGVGFLACAAMFALFLSTGMSSYLASVAGTVAIFMCIGAMMSVGAAMALEPLGANAGMASGLLGTFQLVVGSSFSAILTQLDADPFTLLCGTNVLVGVAVFLVSRISASTN